MATVAIAPSLRHMFCSRPGARRDKKRRTLTGVPTVMEHASGNCTTHEYPRPLFNWAPVTQAIRPAVTPACGSRAMSRAASLFSLHHASQWQAITSDGMQAAGICRPLHHNTSTWHDAEEARLACSRS